MSIKITANSVNGIGSVAAASCSTGLKNLNNFTVSFWIRRNYAFTADSQSYSINKSSGSEGFNIQVGAVTGTTPDRRMGVAVQIPRTGGPDVFVCKGVSTALPNGGDANPDLFPLGVWTHFAVTFDSSLTDKSTKLWWNGIRIPDTAAATGTPVYNSGNMVSAIAVNLSIFKTAGWTAERDVQFANVSIWDAPLNGTALSYLTNNVSPLNLNTIYSTGANLLAYYDFDTVGASESDLSGNGNNLTTISNAGTGSTTINTDGICDTNAEHLIGNCMSSTQDATLSVGTLSPLNGILSTVSKGGGAGGRVRYSPVCHFDGTNLVGANKISFSYAYRIEPDSEPYYTANPVKMDPNGPAYQESSYTSVSSGNSEGLCSLCANTHTPCIRALYRPDKSFGNVKCFEWYVIWSAGGAITSDLINFFNARYNWYKALWSGTNWTSANIPTGYLFYAGEPQYVEMQYYDDTEYAHTILWSNGTKIFDGQIPTTSPVAVTSTSCYSGGPIARYSPPTYTKTTKVTFGHIKYASDVLIRFSQPSGLINTFPGFPDSSTWNISIIGGEAKLYPSFVFAATDIQYQIRYSSTNIVTINTPLTEEAKLLYNVTEASLSQLTMKFPIGSYAVRARIKTNSVWADWSSWQDINIVSSDLPQTALFLSASGTRQEVASELTEEITNQRQSYENYIRFVQEERRASH